MCTNDLKPLIKILKEARWPLTEGYWKKLNWNIHEKQIIVRSFYPPEFDDSQVSIKSDEMKIYLLDKASITDFVCQRDPEFYSL